MPVEGTPTSTTYAGRTNTTVAKPSGLADGEWLLFWHVLGGTPPPTPTAPAGFTLLSGFPVASTVGGFTINGRVWAKYIASAAAEVATDYTVTHSADSSQGVMVRVSGRDPSSPFSPSPTINSGTGLTTTWTGLTTVDDGTDIILFEFDFGDTTADTVVPTGSTPTFTEFFDSLLSFGGAGQLATAGATGDKTHANNNNIGGNGWGSAMIAMAPAGAADPPVNTTPPSISGLAVVGETLTADDGVWSPDGTKTRQWQRRAV